MIRRDFLKACGICLISPTITLPYTVDLPLGLQNIPVDQLIARHGLRDASHFSDYIQKLVDSIRKTRGLLSPIIANEQGEVVDGILRLHAIKRLGHKTVYANICHLDADAIFDYQTHTQMG